VPQVDLTTVLLNHPLPHYWNDVRGASFLLCVCYLDEAKKTLHGIHGIEIIDMTAKVDPNSGKITEYRAAVKVGLL